MRHPFYTNRNHQVEWVRGHSRPAVNNIYDKSYLLSAQRGNHVINDDKEIYRSIGKTLFLNFAGGYLPAYVQSVRINRARISMQSCPHSYEVC